MKNSQDENDILAILSKLAMAGGAAGVAVATAAGVAVLIPAAVGGGICLLAFAGLKAMK